MDAVVLLSGGIDSSVSAYQAKGDIGDGKLYALTFQYGQRHDKEIDSAFAVGEALSVDEHELVRLEIPTKSSLLGNSDIPVSGLTDKIPSTWVPQRNSIFLAMGFAYAESIGAPYVYAGMNCVDYSGYPDCRPEFLEAMNKALNLASKRFVETGKGIQLVTPLLHLTKKDIILKGTELGVDFSLTTSCYQGREKACGVCDSCLIRRKAFQDCGLVDPIEYE